MNYLLCLLLVTSTLASATAVWTKPGTGGSQVRPWPTEFMKSGAFAINGAFKSSHLSLKSSRPAVCNEAVERFAWVTHKLTAKETLTAEAGKKLGTDLSEAFGSGCWNGVQINIEPLPQPPENWVAFLLAVRESLLPKLKLHVVVPVVTTKEITGHKWTSAQALETLGVVDAIAILLYDTGIKVGPDYEALVEENAVFASAAAKQFPDKLVFLGLPAYEDRTALHQKDVETLRLALASVKRKNICDTNVKLALYAEWTLDKKEITAIDAYTPWRKQTCEKGTP